MNKVAPELASPGDFDDSRFFSGTDNFEGFVRKSAFDRNMLDIVSVGRSEYTLVVKIKRERKYEL